MIRRKIEKRINEWIKGSRNALLVSGARQVGKTYIIRECLKNNKVNYVEINLIKTPQLKDAFALSDTTEDLILNMSAIVSHDYVEGHTIIFIDEVQECKDIVTKIKFWVDEGRFRFVLSGSLLGIELNDLRSAPVGYIDEVQMYPLDFEEFLRASKVDEKLIEHLRQTFETADPISGIIHDKMMTHFRRFLVVGGMPEAVEEYIASGDINKVTAIQQSIIRNYKRDFTKYESLEKKLMLISVYDNIPSNLLKQNKRFMYSDLEKGLKFERVENTFLWLTAAGVAISVLNATEPRVSLKQNQKSSLLKLYCSDVGLLTEQYDDALRYGILVNDGKLNLGGVFENAVAQELNAHGFEAFFYNSHRNGELDFLVERGTRVIPIEVKSGKDYYIHSALDKTIKNPEYEIDEAYVFGDCNISVDGKIKYMPIYMCTFFDKHKEMPILSLID